MTYQEYKKARQDEFNNLPIFFAFSNEQFKRAMEERGLTENDVDKVYRFGGTGGFYLKKDADIIRNFMNKPDKLNEYMKNPDKYKLLSDKKEITKMGEVYTDVIRLPKSKVIDTSKTLPLKCI